MRRARPSSTPGGGLLPKELRPSGFVCVDNLKGFGAEDLRLQRRYNAASSASLAHLAADTRTVVRGNMGGSLFGNGVSWCD